MIIIVIQYRSKLMNVLQTYTDGGLVKSAASSHNSALTNITLYSGSHHPIVQHYKAVSSHVCLP